MSQVKKYKIMCDLLWITICFSRVRRFTKDFHEWRTQALKSFEIYTFILQWCIICTFPYEMHGLIGNVRLLTLNLIFKMLQKGKREWIWWWQISRVTFVNWPFAKLTLLKHIKFSNIITSKHVLFPLISFPGTTTDILLHNAMHCMD